MNAWEHLKPQILEIIQKLYYLGWDAEQLSDAINHPDWLSKDKLKATRSPFADKNNYVHFISVDMTLLQACEIVDKLTEPRTVYADTLRNHITELIWTEYEREVKELEAQRELVWSHESVLGREIA